MATCKDCLHYDVCKSYGVIMYNSMKLKMTEKVESKCPYKLFKRKTIKTNADRIRAMSDEELAKYLFDVEQGNFTIDCCDDRFCDTQNCCHDCTDAAIKWLKQPAEGE